MTIICLVFVTLDIRVYGYQVDEIKITVGYFADEQYTKFTVPISELEESCGVNREIYTWISRDNSPGTTEAEGIYVDDILYYCGIDRSEVHSYNFFVDQQAGSYDGNVQEWQDSALFGNRYTVASSFMQAVDEYVNADRDDFLRNPETYYTINDVYDFGGKKYKDSAWRERETVPPMLALRTKSTTWKGYSPGTKLDYTGLSGNGSPMLMFGSKSSNEAGRMLQAQMVSTLHVRYKGTPRIVIETDENESEVGSRKEYQLRVETPDEALTQIISDKIQIQSSNGEVARVEDDGTVTITGEGTADLVATYNNKEYSRVSIKGKKADDEDKEEEKKEEENNGSGSGDGSSSGDGSGSSSGANTGKGAGSGTKDGADAGKGSGETNAAGAGTRAEASTDDKKINTTDSSAGITSDSDTRSDRSAKARADIRSNTSNAANSLSGSAGGAASGSGDSNVKIYKISEAEDSYLERTVDRGLFRGLGGAAGAAVLLGMTVEAMYYRRQINWEEAARKIYRKI